MEWYYFSLLVLFTALTGRTLAANESVKVTVYYKSLGQESIDFITKQLYPTYLTLNKQTLERAKQTRMTTELVPFDDADDEVSLMRNCEPTYNEIEQCLINKIHSCAIAKISDDWQQLNYVNCIMLDGYQKAADCATLTCLDDSPMPSCVNTIDGDELIIENSYKTKNLKVRLSSFPMVEIDGVYDVDEQVKAKSNLLALLCDKFPGNFEGLCDSPRAHRTMTHKNFGTEYNYPEKRRCSF